ncbi:MAG: penicillin-binding protein 1A [Gallionella sp.]|nr:penicillin-binding protein 1A [Gallionella sp.]MDD4945257.1 penicillin-binding protein 1A [Gallionella sp.]MDD5611597.1 penicillin-binding protein 1A [Gallionella sp.]
MLTRRWQLPLIIALALVSLPALLLGIAAMLTYPTLPSLEALTDYHPIVPLRIYSAEGALLGEFGQERRALVKIADVPDSMKHAILAAEDDNFYQHGGVDYSGVLRAALSNLSGGAKQGASTITMQVARNFFLTKEKTFTRKFNEVLLSFKIEHYLSKDEILQLYINQIYLGQRSYGFASAAQIYFGKPLDKLSIAEAAMLAGLPKAPSSYNPVVNPKRAKLRQLYVLRRMQQLNYITPEEYESAIRQPIITKRSSQEFAAKADYLAEMVRQTVYEKYQDAIYTNGYKVYTTIRLQDQIAAYQAVRKGVLDYDRRHGYRGPEGFVDISHDNSDELMDDALQEATDGDDLLPAVVLAVTPTQLTAYLRGGEHITISGEPLRFAQRSLSNKAPLNQRLVPGSIIRAQKIDDKGTWQISQLPQVEAAFVSGNPANGAIYSVIGGFDFGHNKFNHITQAWRQPGSSFKPFIYSASLEKGYTPATIINDAPLSFDASQTGSDPWEPKNYDGKYDGPMRMREALIHSKNLVSIRIMQSITPQYAQDYITKFGFPADKHPPYLTTALGAGSVTPLQMLAGYSIFANGGFRVTPYFIDHIEDAQGNVLSTTTPTVANENAEQVIDVRNAYTMVSMMQDVVKHGTGIRAMQLGRQDLAGKTGTTSDSIDAWFCGFQPTVVGIAWMGFDQPRSLGDKETGGGAALPIWIDYMGKVLKNVPEAEYTMPENMVAARINDNGLRDENGTRVEIFYQENVPPEHALPAPGEIVQPTETIKDQLL